ncbi:MAG: DUF1573 domain-containing protein [Planctomycetota bacterium]|jgi:hypothetical protein
MQDRLSFAGERPADYKVRERLAGNLHQHYLQLVVLFCLVSLAGCAGRAEVADQPIVAGGSTDVPRASHGPTITFDKTVHDYGRVSPRSKNVCEFRFKNTGDVTLTVEPKANSTCGCMATTLARTEYAPGEEGVIMVTYSAGARATTEKRYMTVHSNDMANPQVRLTLKARIVEFVTFEPKKLDLSVKDKTATCPAIKLRSLDGNAFSVTGMLCTGNCIAADFDSSVRATKFTILPKLDVEKLQRVPEGYLALTLTHPKCRRVTIRYKTRSAFQFVPTLPMFFNAEPNVPIQKVVHLSNDNGEDFEIASFSSERNLVDVLEKTKLPSGARQGVGYRLRVSITPPIRTGKEKVFTDTLSVHLADGQTLKLDCRGIYATSQATTEYPTP